MRSAIVLLVGVTTLTGCLETSYAPRDPRKAYVTMHAGQRGYTRNGEFHSDVFGGGLVEVVRGSPEAERAANTFHDRMVGGFVATLVGAVCIPALLGYDLANHFDDGPPISHAYIGLGCAVLMIGGSIAMVSAVPYQMDALNLYNDHVDGLDGWQAPRFPQPPAPMAPPIAPPGAD